MPPGADAQWVAREYTRWLPRFLHPFLEVRGEYAFCLFGKSLLEITFAPERSTPDRQLFYVSGGLLASVPQKERGRLEFRGVLRNTKVISAVHDFVPRLPWSLYKLTQAIGHRLVMAFFSRHLSSLEGRRSPAPAAALPHRTR
jgi:hypothetical protein